MASAPPSPFLPPKKATTKVTTKVPTGTVSASGDYAGFWRRLAAAMIDGVVTEILLAALAATVYFAGQREWLGHADWFSLLLFWLYYAGMESSSKQATLGKLALGIEVTGTDGGQVSFLRATGRTFAKFLSAIPLFIGFLLAGWTARKQALHDMVAGCLVVQAGPSYLWRAVLAATLSMVLLVGGAGAYIYYVKWAEWKRSFLGGIELAATPGISGEEPLPEVIEENASEPVSLSEADYDQQLASGSIDFVEGTTTQAGPAVLALSNFWDFDKDDPSVWVEVYLPRLPNFDVPSKRATILIDRVRNQQGANVYNPESSFESPVFQHLSFSSRERPAPHLHSIRNVHLKPGATEDAIRGVEGRLILLLPVGVEVLTFDATQVGAEQTAGDLKVKLTGMGGSEATIDYTGPANRYIAMLGYNHSGERIGQNIYSYPSHDERPTHNLKSIFDGEIRTIKVVVAASIAEREYPFTLNK